MKLVELLNANGVLTKMADKEMAYGTARKISKNIKVLEEEVTAFEKERTKIAEKYQGDTDPNHTAFYEEMNTLLGTEIEVTGLADFYEHEMEGLQVSPKDLIFIDFLIKESKLTPVA